MWVWVLLGVCTPIAIAIAVIAGLDLARQYDEDEQMFNDWEGEE